jgi:uncharacterized protein
MKQSLIDTGPCIALFDRDDHFHTEMKSFMKNFRGRLITSWAVVTETLHMLDFDCRVQIDFLRWVERGALEVAGPTREDLNRIIELTEKYQDRPIDFADATLLAVAERKQLNSVICIDSDFEIYRTTQGKPLEMLFQKKRF